MEIHKPKPVHSWRDFLSEVGVVVIGIVIALSGEQILEAIHWKHKVEAAEQDLRTELADSLSYALEQQEMSKCVSDPVYVFTWENRKGQRNRVGHFRNSGWIQARRRAAARYV